MGVPGTISALRSTAAVLVATLPIFAFPLLAFSFDQSGCAAGACRDCHQLSADEATRLLAGRFDRVAAVGFSPVPGMWSLEVEKAGRRSSVLLSFSRRHLLFAAPLTLAASTARQHASAPSLTPAQLSSIPLDDAVVLGRREARDRVAVFTDPACPNCEKLRPELAKVVGLDPEVVFFLKVARPPGRGIVPAMVFPDGRVLEGFIPAESILARLRSVKD